MAEADRKSPESNSLTHGLKITLYVVGGFIAIMLLFGFLHPQKSRYQQVMDQCREQFADESEEKVNACAIAILSSELDQREAEKMRRAAR